MEKTFLRERFFHVIYDILVNIIELATEVLKEKMMRLWHQILIPHIPRQQLLGQHRECCALRGNGWGRKHSTVNYVFDHSPYLLYRYHILVMEEMKRRGYHPDALWQDPCYRGKGCEAYLDLEEVSIGDRIYPEHDQFYLRECLENLKAKNIEIIGFNG